MRKSDSRQKRQEAGIDSDKVKDRTRKSYTRNPSDIDTAIQTFRRNIRESPEYICTVCHIAIYRSAVTVFKLTTDISQSADTNEYSHDKKKYVYHMQEILTEEDTASSVTGQ